MNQWMPKDDAITSTGDDSLRRGQHARRVAHVIMRSHSWNSSSVFALVGPWGSGKTSMVNLIVSEFPHDADAGWAVVHFTPWATSDTTSMLEEFFASLTSDLPPRGIDRLRTSIGRLVKLSSPAAAGVPIAGPAAAAAGAAAADHLLSRPPWNVAFERATEQLQALGRPVLIVIDDVDRLHGDELLMLLKVVRLLGRFPGVQYLLAYDEGSVFRGIEAAGQGRVAEGYGQRFLEKIVQYTFPVPPLSPAEQLEQLNDVLTDAQTAADRTLDLESMPSELLPIVRRNLQTPRSMKHFGAHVAWAMACLPSEEVDDRDLFMISLIRTCFPEVHNQLPAWRTVLLTGSDQQIVVGQGNQDKKVDLTRLLDFAPERTRGDVAAILQLLFPRLDGSNRQPQRNVTSRRIREETYFDRYLSLAISAHDLSNATAAAAVLDASNGRHEGLRALFRGKSTEMQDLALDRIQGVPLSAIGPEGVAQMVSGVMLCLGDLTQEDAGFFSTHKRTVAWVAELIRTHLSDDLDHAIRAVQATETLTHELETWRDVRASLERAGTDIPAAISDHMTGLAKDAARAFVGSVRQRDSAPTDDRTGWLLQFALTYGGSSELQQLVQLDLSQDVYTIEDLAARFVGIHILIGPNTPRLGDIHATEFAQVLPDQTDPWFAEAAVEVDTTDVSWRNRRQYARGRTSTQTSNSTT